MRSPAQTFAAVSFFVLATACATPLGRNVPECDDVGNSLILAFQAVEGAEFIPCINSLNTGWEYEHLQATSGESVFWLDSDRMGIRFLQVTLAPSCDTSRATQVPSDEEGAPLYWEIYERPLGVQITIVPEGRSVQAVGYAMDLESEIIDSELAEDHGVEVFVDTNEIDTADRISLAQAKGHFVLVASARDEEEGTMTLLVPGSTIEHSGLTLQDAAERMDELTGPPRYRGFWYYPFVNGCVTYDFNAEGPGVESIETDVQESLGLWPGDVLRQFGRDAGYNI